MNDQVRAERCENCRSTTEKLTANQGNPNLLLYGCKDIKCRHRMLKLDFDADVSKKRCFEDVAPQCICGESCPNAPTLRNN